MHDCTISEEAKESSYKHEEEEDYVFQQDACLSILRSLSKLFGGIIPTRDAINSLKKEGLENPEEATRRQDE
ncbi:MAG: hypothetical protein QW547_04130 [Candidatus Bathyarchaeia archaeon]